jgi:hypothetical protein
MFLLKNIGVIVPVIGLLFYILEPHQGVQIFWAQIFQTVGAFCPYRKLKIFLVLATFSLLIVGHVPYLFRYLLTPGDYFEKMEYIKQVYSVSFPAAIYLATQLGFNVVQVGVVAAEKVEEAAEGGSKRRRRCGECKNCLNLHWKKRCLA